MSTPLHSADRALVRLLGALADLGYRFITPTPLTHQRWLSNRKDREARSVREVLGWNLPFDPAIVPAPLRAHLEEAGVMRVDDEGRHRCGIRVSSIADRLFVHSAFPTDQADAVFFGPDTYRFASFLDQELSRTPPPAGARLLDVGCGSGAGGIVTAAHVPDPAVVMNDINPLALRYTAVNAAAAGLSVQMALGDALSSSTGAMDLIVCNPPYLVDDSTRVYRHGGDRLGRGLAIRIAEESLRRLAPGGRMLLYTGVAIVDGRDPFIEDLAPIMKTAGCTYRYRELDPDVFGEELLRPVYTQIDRIAAVGLVVDAPG